MDTFLITILLIVISQCDSVIYSEAWKKLHSRLAIDWQNIPALDHVNVTGCSYVISKLIEEQISEKMDKSSNDTLYVYIHHEHCGTEWFPIHIPGRFPKGCELFVERDRFKFHAFYNISIDLDHDTPLKSIHLLNIRLPIFRATPFHFLTAHKSTLEVVELKGPPFILSKRFFHERHVATDVLHELSNSLNGTATLEILVIDNFQGQIISPNVVLNVTTFLYPLRLSPLKYLAVRNHGLKIITGGISTLAPYLQILDVSGNSIANLESFPFLMEALFHPYMQHLDVTEIANSILKDSAKDHLNKKKRSLTTSSTLYELRYYNYCMRKLNITIQDMLLDKDSLCKLKKCDQRRVWNPILELPCELINIPQRIKDNNIAIDKTCNENIRIPIGENLTDLIVQNIVVDKNDFSHRSFYKPVCFGKNKLMKLQITHFGTLLHEVNDALNQVPIIGLETLEEIDLSYTNMVIYNLNFFLQSFPNLKNLYSNGNSIHVDQNSSICTKTPLLEILALSRTEMAFVPIVMFEGCKMLKEINLSRNKLKVLDFTINSPLIEVLNFADNPLSRITEPFVIQFSRTEGSPKNINSTRHLHIDFTGCIFFCTCAHIDTITWIQTTQNEDTLSFVNYENYECILVSGGRFNIKDISMNEIDCSNTVLILTTTLSNICIIILIIAILVSYKFRYRLYTFYVMKISRKQFWINMCRKHVTRSDDEIIYDAFVCYCAADRFWVHDVLRVKLENEFGFKLCLHYRDFPIGGSIAETILEFMRKSEKIIYILSDESTKCEWTTFELEQANILKINHGKPLILLKFGKIPKSERSGLISAFLDGEMYIEWPDVMKWELSRNQSTEPQRIIPVNELGNDGSESINLLSLNELGNVENQLNESACNNIPVECKTGRNRKSESLKEEVFWAKLIAALYNYNNGTPCCFCCVKKDFHYSRLEAS